MVFVVYGASMVFVRVVRVWCLLESSASMVFVVYGVQCVV